MRHDADTRLLIVIVGIGIGLFALDLYLPLGIGNGVLYGGLVILSFLLSSRKGPLITASACSVLTMADVVLSPTIEGVPLWMGVTNRLFSLTAIWLPVLFFLHRRRAEEALQEAYDELEERVCERTQELEQSREDLRALAGQLLTAQEEDRRRISRDLHDDINQRLAMLTMDLRQMEKSPPGDAESLRSIIRSMSSRLTTLSDDVRQMAYRFHPSILDDLGLVKAIRRLVDDFSARTGVKTSYVHKDPTVPLPTESSICLYRITQESLNNVSRHAQASLVEVELICEDNLVSLSVCDNGQGFESARPTRIGGQLGLVSMQERVRLAKGRLDVESALGRGTHVRVEIPFSIGQSHV